MRDQAVRLEQRGDLAEAMRWCRRAAEEGDVEAVESTVKLLSHLGDRAQAEIWIAPGREV